MSDEECARTRLGAGANMRQLTADDLNNMEVYNGKGQKPAQ